MDLMCGPGRTVGCARTASRACACPLRVGAPIIRRTGLGYVWLTVWQDGFSDDVLNIDNVQDGPLNAVPEPTSILLLLTMVGLTGFAKYRRTANNRSEEHTSELQ